MVSITLAISSVVSRCLLDIMQRRSTTVSMVWISSTISCIADADSLAMDSTVLRRLLPSCMLLVTPAVVPVISRTISSISLVVSSDSAASLRTSSATTAKPLPCSPARAASIAAFSARRLVWDAIPRIFSTKFAIFSDALLSSSISLTADCTTSPTL